MSGQINLSEVFRSLQSELEASLGLGRISLDHPSTKGDAAEEGWRDLLARYLPSRYAINKAIVIDADGNCSDQIDIVIHDRQYSPFLLNHSGAFYIPAESVYGVFEVKQTFSREHIEYAGQKASSVRRLRRTTAPITHLSGEGDVKSPFEIIGGLLALDWVGSSDFERYIGGELERLESTCSLDIGCCVRAGAFSVANRSDRLFDVSSQSTALVFFLMRLQSVLRSMGTVPAIEFSEYERHL